MSRAVSKVLLACLIGLAAMSGSKAATPIRHVFVIAMENHDARQIYGNVREAPFIQTLLLDYAHATNFNDELPRLGSEPHYIWMEAGTNAFADHTFESDAGPSQFNSTGSRAHLMAQIEAARDLTWVTYQEGQVPSSGACPIASRGLYAVKHNPFLFFRDVSGNPPSRMNDYCRRHMKPYAAFAADLAADKVANYVFITPNLCDDMHGAIPCFGVNKIRAGDRWLKRELPRLVTWVNAHSGVIFLTWDEGRSTTQIPFLAIGPGVKAGYAGSVRYDHGSIVKSVEELFGLPVLPAVAGKHDFGDLFKAGVFP
jgi:phosphatidylinositol-3-phosphatase